MEKLPFTMLSIKNFLFNPVLLACISSWFSAQFIKTVVNIIYGRIHSFSELFETLIWKTGGLPSSHSSLVTCLCTCVGFRNGPDSDVFLVALVFFLVTIRDAVGVRRSNGIQAKKLNEIGKKLDDNKILEYTPIKEVNGHSPMEVIIGIVLGFFIGIAFSVL